MAVAVVDGRQEPTNGGVGHFPGGRRRRIGLRADRLARLADESQLDPVAVDAYLQLGYVPAQLAIFRGVRKLPPGPLWLVMPPQSSPTIHTGTASPSSPSTGS